MCGFFIFCNFVTMKKDIQHCKETGKYCYSSEAKATRAMNKYDDIRRSYFCESCENFHTTKIGFGLAIEKGIIEAPNTHYCSPEEIRKELIRLKNKIKL